MQNNSTDPIYMLNLQIRKELEDIKSKHEQIKAEVRGSLINRREFGNLLYFLATRIRQLSQRKGRGRIPKTCSESPRLNNTEFVVVAKIMTNGYYSILFPASLYVLITSL